MSMSNIHVLLLSSAISLISLISFILSRPSLINLKFPMQPQGEQSEHGKGASEKKEFEAEIEVSRLGARALSN